jgi:hypothetical protein
MPTAVAPAVWPVGGDAAGGMGDSFACATMKATLSATQIGSATVGEPAFIEEILGYQQHVLIHSFDQDSDHHANAHNDSQDFQASCRLNRTPQRINQRCNDARRDSQYRQLSNLAEGQQGGNYQPHS